MVARIEARLTEIGRDWAWLSRQTGISTSALSEMRTKHRVPRADRAIAIAKALDMDFEWLATGATASRDKLDSAREELVDGASEVVRMYGMLSRRERIAVWQLLETLSGASPATTPFASGDNETLHDPRLTYRARD